MPQVLPRRLDLLSAHPAVRPVAVAAGEAHTVVYRSDGSMVTIGRLTHGRGAEGGGEALQRHAAGCQIRREQGVNVRVRCKPGVSEAH